MLKAHNHRQQGHTRHKLLLGIVGISLFIYLGVLLALYLLQDKLIFPGASSVTANVDKLTKSNPGSAVVFHLDDENIGLQGWNFNDGVHKPTIFYYGGNAEDISAAALQFATLTQFQSVFVNYRGYGLSTGTPSEKNLYQDALMIFDRINEDAQPSQVFIIGRSLGTGIATYVASMRKVDGLVLVTPFDSLTSIGKDRHPFMPVSLMIRHHFDSLSRAGQLKMPTLVLLAESDAVVPRRNSSALMQALPHVTDTKTLPHTTHDNIIDSPDYLPAITAFLSALKPSAAVQPTGSLTKPVASKTATSKNKKSK